MPVAEQSRWDRETELQRLNVLYRLLAALTRADSLSAMCQAAVDGLSAATSADRAAVLLFDDDGVMRFEAWRDLSDSYREAVTGHSPWRRGERNADTITVPDVLLDESMAGFRNAFAAEGIRSVVFIPLALEAGVFGKFMLYHPEPHRWAPQEIELAQAIAVHVSIAAGRWQTERQRSQTEQRLAAIVESSEDAIVSKNLNGIVTSWNKGAERVFGYTAEEMLGRPIAVLAAPEARYEMPAILAKIRQGERVEHYDTVRRRKDGSIIHISLRVSPIRDSDGRIIGASKIARDITERIRAEQERASLLSLEREARRIAEQAQAELERSIQELRRTNQDLESFSYSASHDLKEPLRTIAISAQLLERTIKPTAAGAEFLARIQSAADRMRNLLEDLTAYMNATNAGALPRSPADTAQALASALASSADAIESTGAEIIAGALPPANMPENQIAQVFQKLIGNAIRYRGGDPPRIHVSGEQIGGNTVFSITDNGIGIDMKYADHIFGLFKRLHGSSELPGSGMGLPICRRLVEHYGGKIWLEKSRVGEGSTFRFTLPVRSD